MTRRRSLADARMPLVPAPALHGPLWGFFWTDCVYESGLALQSLHRSKIGALRAMIAAQAARWEECRSGALSCVHCDGLGTFAERDYRDRRAVESYAVRPVKVLP